jgi:hypothetical protein
MTVFSVTDVSQQLQEIDALYQEFHIPGEENFSALLERAGAVDGQELLEFAATFTRELAADLQVQLSQRALMFTAVLMLRGLLVGMRLVDED